MVMCIHLPKRTILWAGILILLGACNQLDTVLPSAGTYRVNALVNRSSLDECSVIAAGDTVLPYFSSSVADDPDLVNLVVYLENSEKKQVGNRVRYTTEPVPAAETPLETETPSEAPPAEPLPVSGETETAKTETAKLETTKAEAGGGGAEESRIRDTGDPAFAGGLVIPVDNFTGQLPPFPIAGDIEIGYYTMVFEIRGKQALLGRAERQIFYTADREFTSEGIRYYLPGFYGNRHLAPQGVNVMLETTVNHGEDLAPYIVWYNGNRRIGEGFVAGGTARLLWKASQQTGFHTIRAELFPFEPRSATRGLVRELSLPVSSETEGNQPARNGEFLYYYQLAGDLREAGTGAELGRKNLKKPAPLWYPAEQIYGLALEDGDGYEAPSTTLDLSGLSGDKEGLLRFFIRFLPLKEGTIFNALLGGGPEPVAIRLSIGEKTTGEKTLRLDLEKGNNSIPGGVLEIDETRGAFIGVALDVEIRRTGIRASLEPADSPLPHQPPAAGEEDTLQTAELGLDSPIDGELRSWLGKAETTAAEGGEATAPATNPGSSPVPLPVAVVDDFSALFRVSDISDISDVPDMPGVSGISESGVSGESGEAESPAVRQAVPEETPAQRP
jgi:hypothetical protein